MQQLFVHGAFVVVDGVAGVVFLVTKAASGGGMFGAAFLKETIPYKLSQTSTEQQTTRGI